MKKVVLLIVIAVSFVVTGLLVYVKPIQPKKPQESQSSQGGQNVNTNNSGVINHDKAKAIWIFYNEIEPMLKGKTEEEFTKNISDAYDNVIKIGGNTVVVHVRAFGDSFYPSKLFPYSSYANGLGVDIAYDPLKIMIDKAHEKNLSFHAWLNPYRGLEEKEVSQVAESFPFKQWYNDETKKGNNIVQVGTRWFYNPSVEESRKLIVDGVSEIVNNYKVDAIHFDDYFYPTTDESFDKIAYDEYKSGGGTLTLDDWRRENVDKLVKEAYDLIKSVNKDIDFGISPQANISNNYSKQYADIKKWCSQEGYIDYICPQIYYNFDSETKNFEQSFKEWEEIVALDTIKFYVGLAPYKLGKTDKWACFTATDKPCASPEKCGANGWIVSDEAQMNILQTQYDIMKQSPKFDGAFLFSYKTIFTDQGEHQKQIQTEMGNFIKAWS